MADPEARLSGMHCGAQAQGEVPMSTWDRYAPIWQQKMGVDGDYWSREIFYPSMMELCGDGLPGRRTLDLGCGLGGLSFLLEAEGLDVVGVDSSPRLIDEAKRRAEAQKSTVKFYVADARNLSLPGHGTFELIVCNMALQDMPDANRAMQESARMAELGARAVFSVRHPCTDGWEENYLLEQDLIFPLQEEWQGVTEERLYPPRHHRPVAYYVNELIASGFAITRCAELMSTPEPRGHPLALVLTGVRTT